MQRAFAKARTPRAIGEREGFGQYSSLALCLGYLITRIFVGGWSVLNPAGFSLNTCTRGRGSSAQACVMRTRCVCGS